jgi:hypothetical protein
MSLTTVMNVKFVYLDLVKAVNWILVNCLDLDWWQQDFENS